MMVETQEGAMISSKEQLTAHAIATGSLLMPRILTLVQMGK